MDYLNAAGFAYNNSKNKAPLLKVLFTHRVSSRFFIPDLPISTLIYAVTKRLTTLQEILGKIDWYSEGGPGLLQEDCWQTSQVTSYILCGWQCLVVEVSVLFARMTFPGTSHTVDVLWWDSFYIWAIYIHLMFDEFQIFECTILHFFDNQFLCTLLPLIALLHFTIINIDEFM